MLSRLVVEPRMGLISLVASSLVGLGRVAVLVICRASLGRPALGSLCSASGSSARGTEGGVIGPESSGPMVKAAIGRHQQAHRGDRESVVAASILAQSAKMLRR